MDNAEDTIINEIKKLIGNLKKKHSITAAYIFGSYTKGKSGRHSDIDIAIILSKIKDGSPFNEAFEIFHEVQRHNSLYEVICFSENEFNYGDDFIIRQIKSDGLKII